MQCGPLQVSTAFTAKLICLLQWFTSLLPILAINSDYFSWTFSDYLITNPGESACSTAQQCSIGNFRRSLLYAPIVTFAGRKQGKIGWYKKVSDFKLKRERIWGQFGAIGRLFCTILGVGIAHRRRFTQKGAWQQPKKAKQCLWLQGASVRCGNMTTVDHECL